MDNVLIRNVQLNYMKSLTECSNLSKLIQVLYSRSQFVCLVCPNETILAKIHRLHEAIAYQA